MKIYRQYFVVVCLMIFAFSMFSGCKQVKEPEKAPEIVANVAVLDVQSRTLTEELTLSGSVKAAEDILLASELGGPVEWVGVEEGQTVKKDQVLGKVNLKTLEAALNQAEAQYELAKLNYERQKQLFEKKLISPGEMDKYRADHKVAEANHKSVKVQYEKGLIHAPINGRLDRLDLDVGEILVPGKIVGRIVDVKEVEVIVSVPEKDVAGIKEGDKVAVHIMSQPDVVYKGDVSFVALGAEEVSKTFPAKILINNPDNIFRPGMIVTVSFRKKPRNGIIVLPQSAVLVKEGRKWVFLVKDAVAIEREVNTGAMVQDEVEILDGLSPGDSIVIRGQHNLLDGDKIKVVSGGSMKKEESN
ncbi:MAG: efflux RND transporter periplasmic adaptor subunit [Candidatus Theseobacter exili]|nr:efflux RND transporter periplasmic adaptor subunit [Candidatus Theseobacter exili]